MKTLFNALKDFFKIYYSTKNKEYVEDLKSNKFLTDWIGRPYFDFEIPSEFFESELTLNSFVWKKISDYYFIFTKRRYDLILLPITYIDYKNMRCLVLFSTDLKPIRSMFKILWYSIVVFLIVLLFHSIYIHYAK